MNNIRFEEQEFYDWLQTTEYNGPVGITAKFYLKDGAVSRFREVMKNNVDVSVGEVGVRHYKLHADYENPLIFWLIEEWDTVTDLKNHCVTESYVANSKVLVGELLKDPICHIALYKALD